MSTVFYRLTALAILLCHAGTADAYGSLRCKDRIIDPGATMAEVLALCGSPSRQLIRQVPVRAGTGPGYSRFIGLVTDEQWVYDRGWGKFPAVLTFYDGRVQRIDYLPFRSGDE